MHRAPTIAEEVRERLQTYGYEVGVVHLGLIEHSWSRPLPHRRFPDIPNSSRGGWLLSFCLSGMPAGSGDMVHLCAEVVRFMSFTNAMASASSRCEFHALRCEARVRSAMWVSLRALREEDQRCTVCKRVSTSWARREGQYSLCADCRGAVLPYSKICHRFWRGLSCRRCPRRHSHVHVRQCWPIEVSD